MVVISSLTGDINSPHPAVPNCYLTDFNPKPESSEVVTVEITYKENAVGDGGSTGDPNAKEIEIGTSVSQGETNKDFVGEPVVLEYTYPEDYKGDEKKRGVTVLQGGLLQKLIPESTIRVTIKNQVSPGALSRAYVGYTNDGPWTLDMECVADQWLCTSITGRSSNGGATYTVLYEFAYRSDGWQPTAVFINPDDGKPPPDLEDELGSILVALYGQKDLNSLNL